MAVETEHAFQQAHRLGFRQSKKKGAHPLWPDMVLKRYLQPAAERAGIAKRVGWHTFRHIFLTLLRANGEDIKVVQELLRNQLPVSR